MWRSCLGWEGEDGCSRQRKKHMEKTQSFQRAGVFRWWGEAMELGGVLEKGVQDQWLDCVLHSGEPMKGLREGMAS